MDPEMDDNIPHQSNPPMEAGSVDATGSQAPMRVLVQTLTNLVPTLDDKSDIGAQIIAMADRICQHQWGSGFDRATTALHHDGCEFEFKNRPCYVLLDRGDHPDGPGGDPSKVVMKVYDWDGKNLYVFVCPNALKAFMFSLSPTNTWCSVFSKESLAPLSSKIRRRLKNCSFRPSLEQRLFGGFPEKVSPEAWRNFILKRICNAGLLRDKDLDFVLDNTEHAAWLKANMAPRYWEILGSLTTVRGQDRNQVGAMQCESRVWRGTIHGSYCAQSWRGPFELL